MASQSELEALSALEAARATGNVRAELAALQALEAISEPASIRAQQPDSATFGEAATRGGATRLLDTTLNTFPIAGNIIASGAAAARVAPETVSRLVTGQPIDLGDRFSIARQEELNSFPSTLLQAIKPPMGTAENVVAGTEALMNIPGGLLGNALSDEPLALGQRFDESKARGRQVAADNPIATQIGELGADALTLATGRIPFASRIKARELRASIPRNLDAATSRLSQLILNSPKMQALQRGAGRAVETTIEGAVLGAINDGNPLEVAAYSAGFQMAGSSLITLTRGALRHPVRAAVGAIVAHQVGKSLFPGGNDFILPTIEEGFDQVTTGMVLGVLAGAAGAGRLRNSAAAERLPKTIDALTAVPRGAVISLVAEMTGDRSNNIERVLQQYVENPEFFDPKVRNRIEQAISDDTMSLSDTVNSLIDNDSSFAAKIDAIGTPAATLFTQDTLRSAVSEDNNRGRILRPRRLAERAASVVGSDRARRLGFDSTNTGPKQFLQNAFQDAGATDAMRKRMSKSAFTDALTVNLDGMITASVRPAGDKRFVDGADLRQRWDRLSSNARGSYTEPQQEAIESFIEQTTNQPLTVLPPLAATSLMTDGQLANRLRGQPIEQVDK